MQRLVLAVLAASIGLAGSAHAQRPRAGSRRAPAGCSTATRPPRSVPPSAMPAATSTPPAASAAASRWGYLVTPRLLAYAGFDLAKQAIDVTGLAGDFGLTHLEAGARLSFPIRHSKALPYLGLWAGRRSLSTTVDNIDTGASSRLSMSGMAVGGSGGVQMFVSPKLALDGGLSVGVGKLGNVKVDGQHQDWGTLDNSTTTRIRFGANWYP
jgi:hypothetical protein